MWTKHQQSDFMLHVLCLSLQHSSAYAYVFSLSFSSRGSHFYFGLSVAAFVSRNTAWRVCVYARDAFVKFFFNVETIIITMSE